MNRMQDAAYRKGLLAELQQPPERALDRSAHAREQRRCFSLQYLISGGVQGGRL